MLTILTEENSVLVNSIQFFFLNKSVCVSDLSHMFAQSITSTHSFVKKYKCLKKKGFIK